MSTDQSDPKNAQGNNMSRNQVYPVNSQGNQVQYPSQQPSYGGQQPQQQGQYQQGQQQQGQYQQGQYQQGQQQQGQYQQGQYQQGGVQMMNNDQQQQNKQQRNHNIPPPGYKLPRYEREPLPENAENNEDLGGAYQRYIYACGDCCGSCKTCCPCMPVEYPWKQIDQSFVGIFERFGKYVKTVQPGLIYFNPCTDQIYVLDTKTQMIDCPKQTVITKDNILVNIDATVYYRIVVPRKSQYCVDDLRSAVSHLALATIKCIAGTHTLQDLLDKRTQVTEEIEAFVEEHIWDWGIDVERLLIKDILINNDLQNTLSMVLKEQRIAQGKIISAKADVESAKLMREAASFLDSKAAMQIRYLETITILGQQGSTKIVFMPDDKQ